MIALLAWLIIFSLVMYAVFLVAKQIPIPEPAKTLVIILIAVVFLLVLFQYLGIMDDPFPLGKLHQGK